MNIWAWIKSLFGATDQAANRKPVSHQPPPTAGPHAAAILWTASVLVTAIEALCKRVRRSVLEEYSSHEDPHRLKEWTELTEFTVRDLYRGPIDPNNPWDADILKENADADAEVTRAANQAGRSEENWRQAKSATRAKEPRPQLPTPVIVAGLGSFTLLFTLTFFELPMLKGIEDLQAHIMFAAIPSLILSSLMVFSSFHVTTESDKVVSIWTKDLRNVDWQTAGGILLIIFLGAARWFISTGLQQHGLSVAFMGMELSLWAYMKGSATRSAAARDEYDRRHDSDAQKNSELAFRAALLAKDEKILADAIAAQAEARRKRAARMEHDFPLDPAIKRAVADVRNTYFEAISQIKGRSVMGNYFRPGEDNAQGGQWRNEAPIQ